MKLHFNRKVEITRNGKNLFVAVVVAAFIYGFAAGYRHAVEDRAPSSQPEKQLKA